MEQFGRYVLSERVASGGMAEIWRGAVLGARGFSRPLAIKRIRPEHTHDADFIRMFVDEARIASSLSHPNVVAVTDFGEVNGQYFLAMEYVAGRHLGIVLGTAAKTKMPLPPAFGVAVVRDALLGLAHAHEKTGVGGAALQIVHRDISPQNILVGFDGSARVADFGIAKARGRLTQTDSGSVKGKYSYMSPEQARGEEIDARSDIYAMGVVLWESLAGRRLYGPELDQAQTFQRVMQGDARRLGDVAPQLPQSLVDVVACAMAPRREERFQNAQAFARALSTQLAAMAPGWTVPDAAAVMKRLFTTEMETEQASLAVLESMARKLSDVGIPAFTGAPPPEPSTEIMEPTVAAPPAPRRTGPLLAGALLLGTLVAGGVMMRMETAPPPAPMTSILVESIPAGAAISVDGNPVGTTPVDVRWPTGSTAHLRATLEGRAITMEDVVARGARMVVVVELPPR